MNEAICCAECKTPGRLYEDDFGYTVKCPNPKCNGVESLFVDDAMLTKRAAWEYWEYLNKPTVEAKP